MIKGKIQLKLLFFLVFFAFLSCDIRFTRSKELGIPKNLEDYCQLYLRQMGSSYTCQKIKKLQLNKDRKFDEYYKRWGDVCHVCSTLRGAIRSKEDFKEWIDLKHLRSFCEVANDLDVMITFRKSGTYTISKIQAGYPTKGHDILAKTIKPKTLKPLLELKEIKSPKFFKFYPDSWITKGVLFPKILLQKMKEANYFGFVGWWKETTQGVKIPVGVYTVSSGCSALYEGQTKTVKPLEGGCRLSFKDLAFREAKDIYTGDYDLHDLILINEHVNVGFRVPSNLNRKANRRAFPANSKKFIGYVCDLDNPHLSNAPYCVASQKENLHVYDFGSFDKKCNAYTPEIKISCFINKKINRVCHTSDSTQRHCSLVRHGPQANYFEYQQKTGEKFVPDLMLVSEKLGVVEPMASSRDCRYYILGEQKRYQLLQEYRAVYSLARRGFGALKGNEGPIASVLHNTEDRSILIENLQGLEKKSLKQVSSKLMQELDDLTKRKIINTHETCISALYKAEMLKEILKNKRFSIDFLQARKHLKSYSHYLCQEKDSRTCAGMIRRSEGKKALKSWKLMATEFCDES